jgi:CHRD domain-containing protein
MKTVLIIIAIFGSISISHAQFNFYFYSASLDGSQEIPPNSSPGIGDADFTLSNTTFSVTSGSYSDLQGNASGITVNISPPPGTNSPVIFSLTLNSPGTTSEPSPVLLL